MAKALKCDRCGGFYDLLTETRKYRIEETTVQKPSYQKTVDLCPDCYEKFCDFLNGAWKSIGMKPKEIVGTGELYPGEFESRHYEFEDCDNIKGERVIKCREESE